MSGICSDSDAARFRNGAWNTNDGLGIGKTIASAANSIKIAAGSIFDSVGSLFGGNNDTHTAANWNVDEDKANKLGAIFRGEG